MDFMGQGECCAACGCEFCGGDADCQHEQRHVHEIVGSVKVAEAGCDAHAHRFATVSGEAIPNGRGDHMHEIRFHTDFYEGHYHEFCGRSGGAIPVGNGRHVHFAQAQTQPEDGHRHSFMVASLIDDPTGD